MNPLAALVSSLAKSALPYVLNEVLKQVTVVLEHRSSEHHKNADKIAELETRIVALEAKQA